ncbi:MAG: zinc-binding dehydrogenase [Chloroflexi bacterium]|nr:zinc-binding dehydrogenase [Chloroflexota bacterium]
MRAAVFHAPHAPLALEEAPEPRCGERDILIQVAACGLCHSDLHYIDHGVKTFKAPPLILGHEASGVVVEVGAAARDFKVGDRVLIPPIIPCNTCRSCRSGRANVCERLQMFGNDVDGAFAQYVAAPAAECFHLPEEIPLVEASVISDAVTTPFHGVRNRARVQAGETVAIFGCGGVGLNAVQVAALLGAIVIAVDISPEKLEWARRFGAVEAINPRDVPDVPRAIRRLTGGGADVAVEAIGRPQTQEQAFSSLRGGGRLLLMGFSAESMALNAGRTTYREIEVIGTLGCRPVDFPAVIELVRRGKLQVVPLVTGRFALSEINAGLDALRSGQGIRNVVLPQER